MNNFIEGLKYIWHLGKYNHLDALEFSVKYNINPSIIQVLLNRDINTHKKIESFIFTSYEENVYSPSLLKDSTKAVLKIVEAINSNQKILISGDYDVDGITSTAMMIYCLLKLNANVNFFLPNRISDGYGLSIKIVEKAIKNNYKVIITVDNGITSFQAADLAYQNGIDLIITDHHRPHDILPKAYAIINPHQKDCNYPFKKLAGVGVTFKLLSLLYQHLNQTLPSKIYELLLLGTIADIVPLVDENRYWVKYALDIINKKNSLSLKILKKNVKLSKDIISSKDIGYFITPQINALGRLTDPRDGVKFLLSNDHNTVYKIGDKLNYLNKSRKDIEKKIFNEVEANILKPSFNLESSFAILDYSKNWNPGVIGLVASKISNIYNRPTILLHLDENELILKGSARSIRRFNIFNAISSLKDLLISFGGHSYAAGLSLEFKNFQIFKDKLNNIVKDELGFIEKKSKIDIDSELFLNDFDNNFMNQLKYLEPFGYENNSPIFLFKDLLLLEPPLLFKDLHVRAIFIYNGFKKTFLFFNQADVYNFLIENYDKSFNIIGELSENSWNNKSYLEIHALDIAINN